MPRWLKWIAIAAGVLALMVLIVLGIGASLPVSHTATVSLRLDASPDSVWRVVRDLGDYPDWWPDVISAEARTGTEGREVWLHENSYGEKMPLLVEESREPNLLVTRIADENLPFGGTWTYRIEPVPQGGSRITVTEEGEVYNPFFRFMSRFVFGHYSTMESFLFALASHFGEEAELERRPKG